MAFAQIFDRAMPAADIGESEKTLSGAQVYSLALARAKRKHEALAADNWNGAGTFTDEDFGDFPPLKR